MPIPFLLAGLGIAAAAIGAGGHLSAKETNEEAQRVSEEAQSIYNSAKSSLDEARAKTEKSLLALGYSKKKVLETSIKQFLTAYDRVIIVETKQSIGIDELENFSLDKQDALQLREMSDIYQSTFASGAAGAATGAVIAFAASGSLPAIGTLATAGTALMAGEVGLAASFAGAAMTPLAAIAAPVILFTGVSASLKADENLEKARTMYAEAEAAAEKMETSKTICLAIDKRADMFDDLLKELNDLFAQCTSLFDGVTRKKLGIFKNKKIYYKTLTSEEKKLMAVTGSLAKAVKAVIDTPILTSTGEVSANAKTVLENTKKALPEFVGQVEEVKQLNLNAKPIAAKLPKQSTVSGTSSLPEVIRNIFAVVIGCFASWLVESLLYENIAVKLLTIAVVTLLIMNNYTKIKLFKIVKKLCNILIAVCFGLIFYDNCGNIVGMKHYIIGSIVIGIVSFFIFIFSCPESKKKSGNIRRTVFKLSACILLFAAAILLFALLHKLIGISRMISAIIVVIPYVYFSRSAVFLTE